MKKQIVCVHLLNGFTGSPNVLATVVNGLFNENYDVTLLTSLNNKGFLSDVNCTQKINISYVFKKNTIGRLFQFLKFQFFATLFLLKTNRNDIVYLNTIQPFLPAIFAKLRGNKVIYHIHEAYPKKSFFTSFLFFIVQVTSTKIICVSEYVLNELNLKSKEKASVIYNSLSLEFCGNQILKNKTEKQKAILMVSSAREYKGVFEFCKLALLLDEYNFVLVCDASKQEISELFDEYKNISNLQLVATQTDLHPFYAKADLIMNLSIPSQIIETFGLTILEGMSYGLPCIVPPVGGITELVDEGVNGYKVDSRETEGLVNKIRLMLEDDVKYKEMSNEAIKTSKNFSFDVFINKIKHVIG
jgi:glycosyltransferase involved in cell wall biosynthesis